MGNVLLKKSLRDHRVSVIWWCVGLVALSYYLMYFYPYISNVSEIFKVIDRLPPIVKNLIGEHANLATPEGFFNIQPFSMMAPLIFLIFAIMKGGDAVAGEVDRGTLDLLAANPLPRWRLVSEKFAAVAIAMGIMAGAFWIGMASGSVFFSIKLSVFRLAETIFGCYLLGLGFAAITLAFSCLWQKRKLVTGIVTGLAIVGYLVNAYAPMVEVLKPYRVFTPFYYYNGNSPLINGLNPWLLLVQVAIVVAFFGLAVVFFRKADIVE